MDKSYSDDLEYAIRKNIEAAQKCEKDGDYHNAIIYYKFNVENYNDSTSKINLARLYLDGKAGKIDNKYARRLLEEAYSQNNDDTVLLAYVMANGIGGPKLKIQALNLLKKELKKENPDEMVYIELAKLIPNNKKNREFRKKLLSAVGNFEKFAYKRKRSINKFNNTLVGRFVNTIPNYIKMYYEESINKVKDSLTVDSQDKLFEKANVLYNDGEYDKAFYIYKRLHLLGDKEASLKYAKMLTKGLGTTKKDPIKAKEIYESIISERQKRLEKVNKKLRYCQRKIESTQVILSQDVWHMDVLDIPKRIKASKTNKRFTDEELKQLNKRKNILINSVYEDAILDYGILLSNNITNQDERNKGIKLLKHFAQKGEYIPNVGKKLSSLAEESNKRARKAIKKLGRLYESGRWEPENIEEERKMFFRFNEGSITEYTTSIAELMRDSIYKRVKDNKLEKSKKTAVKYIASYFDKDMILHEEYGRFYSFIEYGDRLLKDSDITGAVEMYKASAQKGIGMAKRKLNMLYAKGLWIPENEAEKSYIKQKTRIKHPRVQSIPSTYFPDIIKTKSKRVLATSLAAATAFMANPNLNIRVDADKKLDSNSQMEENYDYSIGDEIELKDGKSVLVGMVGYIPETQTILKKKDFQEDAGLSVKDYLDNISKEYHIDIDKIELLFCLKDKKVTSWISQSELRVKLMDKNPIKKEEEVELI